MALMILNNHYLHVHLRAESINWLTLFHTLLSISPVEDCSKNINLLLPLSWHLEFLKEVENLTQLKLNIWSLTKLIQTHHQFQNHWKDSLMKLFGQISRVYNRFQFLVAWDQAFNNNIWYGRNGINKKESSKSANYQRTLNKLVSSINCCFIEQCVQTEYHLHWTTLLDKWWMKDISNNRHSTFSIHLPNLIREFHCSLCCSLVLIRRLKLKELLLNIIFLLLIRSLLIFLWVKVKKNQLKMPCSMLLRKDIGSCCKTYI